MNSKIIIGIIIGIAIIVGVGYSSSVSDSDEKVQVIIEEDVISESNNEGQQFSLKLSDSVTASGP